MAISLKFGDHVIDAEHPFPSIELGEFLDALEVFHPVDIAGLRDGQFAPPHLIGGVCHDIELSAESEVLLVVGCEVKQVALVVFDVDADP